MVWSQEIATQSCAGRGNPPCGVGGCISLPAIALEKALNKVNKYRKILCLSAVECLLTACSPPLLILLFLRIGTVTRVAACGLLSLLRIAGVQPDRAISHDDFWRSLLPTSLLGKRLKPANLRLFRG